MVTTPALYDVEVAHRRSERLDYGFTTRMYLWLVDLDHLPRPRGPLAALAGFEAADHAGDPARSIRANVEEFLADHDVDLDGGRVLMLAHARVLGYVFNPITLYWCHHRDGALAAVVAEVHNTYGGRHRYLLDVDAAGRARVDKAFYVSPFFTVDGEYRMRVPEPGAALAATIVLRRDGETAFVATMRGRRRSAGPLGVLAAAVRHPLVTAKVSGLIRRHGIALWARGVPLVPRPDSDVAPRHRRSRHTRGVRASSPGPSATGAPPSAPALPSFAPVLRRAGPADADALLALVHAAYRGETSRAGWTTEADLLDGPRTTRELLAADLADPGVTVLVAVDPQRPGELLGCAAVTVADGGGGSDAPGASFGMFAVRPDGQGAGVGSRLLVAAQAHARAAGATALDMTVLAPRADLRAWYARRGYAPTGETRPFPYGDERFGRPRRDDLHFVVLRRPLGLPE